MKSVVTPPRCPACEQDRWSIAYRGLTDRLYGLPGEFDLWRCGSCGLLRLWQLPEDVTSFYPADYYSHQYVPPARQNCRQALTGHVRRWQLLAAWRAHRSGRKLPSWFTRNPRLRSQAYEELTRFAPVGVKSLLDIGCGIGDFLAGVRTLGLKARGVEISESAIEAARARGLDCDSGGISHLAEMTERFDVIRAFHVLEHLEDPLEGLRNIAGTLAPDGVAIVGVPNADGVMARLCGEDWFPLEVPRHLWGFGPRSLGLLLARAGLALERMHYSSYNCNLYRSLRNLLQSRAGLELSETSPPKSLVSLCARIGWLIDSVELGDCLVAVAKRLD